MRGPRNEVRRARCLPQFRYPEVAPISGHRSVDLSGAAGGLWDYASGAGSEPPHPYPQQRAIYRSSQVTAIMLTIVTGLRSCPRIVEGVYGAHRRC